MDRYIKNRNLINSQEQKLLSTKTVAIVGLGGLGGHAAEQLARLGFGHLILIDDDVAAESNLNRQLFVTEKGMGIPKAELALERLRMVNSSIKYTVHNKRLTSKNAALLLEDADIVIDALDNIPGRLMLQEACKHLAIPLVHGSIGGWWGQVCVVFPGDDSLSRIYSSTDAIGVEKEYGNPPFTPALVASIQVAEALKCCLNRPEVLRGMLLCVNLLQYEHFTIKI